MRTSMWNSVRQNIRLLRNFSSSRSHYCNGVPQVRVRFAPSPTGQLHIGGLRTALYNHLFAQSHGGKFILRIEDTDQKRYVVGASEKLVEMLTWAGIQIDEGPFQGGHYGPYFQSERIDIYHQYVDKLLQNGTAYRCFCTERRLNLMRKEQRSRGETPKYDNRCRYLSESEIEEKIHNGIPYTIRFKLHEHKEPWQDLVYGPIICDISKIEGDPILIKADRFPTYHFANVVDDHLMQITHVLRGVEWQVSTTKHLLLYKAFGWEPPEIAHLPLLMNKDGKKISKRQNEGHVEYFKDNGLYADTLINFLTCQGSGFTRHDTVGLRIDELVSYFNLSLLNTNSTKVDFEKIGDINKEHIRRKLSEPRTCKEVINSLRQLILDTMDFHDAGNTDHLHHEMLSDEHLKAVLEWAIDRITKVEDLVGRLFRFLWTVPSSSEIEELASDLVHVKIIEAFLDEVQKISASDLVFEWVAQILKGYSENNKVEYKTVMRTIRKAVSGMNSGPSVSEMCVVLGKDMLVHKLRYALDLIEERKEMSVSECK